MIIWRINSMLLKIQENKKIIKEIKKNKQTWDKWQWKHNHTISMRNRNSQFLDGNPLPSKKDGRSSACMHAKSLEMYSTLFDPVDHGPPGTAVHGILQARALERVAIVSSGRSSWPMNWTYISCMQVNSLSLRLLRSLASQMNSTKYTKKKLHGSF